jgi:peptide/nickel transport system permease protein
MHSVLKLVAQRIALGLLLLLAASVLIFVGTQILPGDVAQAILGQGATPQALKTCARNGLNDPPPCAISTGSAACCRVIWARAVERRRTSPRRSGSALGNTLFLAFCGRRGLGAAGDPARPVAVRYRDRWPDKLISAHHAGPDLAAGIPHRLFADLFLAVQLRLVPLGGDTVYDGMSFWASG